MDEQLKAALIKKIELSQAELEVHQKDKAPLEVGVRKTHLSADAKRPNNALFERVKRKLLKERLWGAAEEQLARVGFDLIVAALNRKAAISAGKVALSAAKVKQLELFPGFENLPTRIRKGRNYLKFPELSVEQFLAYEDRYQVRAQRNQQVADELHRLAQALRPLKADYPDMPLPAALARAQAEAPALAVVAKRT